MREGTRAPTASETNSRGTRKLVLEAVPGHVAIIMDGNGRWATQQGWSRSQGHQAGTENVRKVARAFAEYGVKYLTIFAFSTENWDRPDEEVQTLLGIFSSVIEEETKRLHEEGIRIRHIGRSDRVPSGLQEDIRRSVDLTKNNARMTLSVAFDYGGRAEILDAVKRIVADGLPRDEITEEVFRRYLYTGDIPDPDMIIRTGGEMRLSNFLLWQSAYTEYYSTPVLWPEFNEDEVARALSTYNRRQRRFGRVVP